MTLVEKIRLEENSLPLPRPLWQNDDFYYTEHLVFLLYRLGLSDATGYQLFHKAGL